MSFSGIVPLKTSFRAKPNKAEYDLSLYCSTPHVRYWMVFSIFSNLGVKKNHISFSYTKLQQYCLKIECYIVQPIFGYYCRSC